MTERRDQVEKVRDMLKEEYKERGFEDAVGVGIGAASVCWDSMERTGVFHSSEAAEIVSMLMDFHKQEVEKAVRIALNRVQLPHPIDAHSAKSGLFDPTKEEGD